RGAGESGVGRVPLTPIQRWWLEEARHPGQFSQTLLLEVSEELGVGELRRALQALVERHDQLRARFWREADGSWVQEVPAEVEPGGGAGALDGSAAGAGGEAAAGGPRGRRRGRGPGRVGGASVGVAGRAGDRAAAPEGAGRVPDAGERRAADGAGDGAERVD